MTQPHSVTVRELYVRELRERGFQDDAVQLAAVAELDALRSRLIERHAREHTPWRRSTAWMRHRRDIEPERGLYLYGGVGRGKTWLMDLFYRSLPFPERRRRHFHRFMHDVHAGLAGLDRRASPLAILARRIASEAQILCFDELYVSEIGDAMILGTLLAELFRRGVTLVTTSNVPATELYRDGLQRDRFLPAIALLERHTAPLAVDGPVDYRLRRLASAGTYLSSCDTQQTNARLTELFAELTEHPQEGGSIEIEGRRIAVVRAGDTAAWFEFSSLCMGPRSTDDYIEIAREYQSIVLANVPVLDALSEDAARRFIALIDELYDHGVILVISAAAPAGELYRGERLRAEYRRTASRLNEMQTRDYLAREHRS
ncbi:MAG TPA: cell division protein ZapE [Steroidobacteraceae bacterium]|nr:cell division protein ZapE [Steroidobacteraceae bacterium]